MKSVKINLEDILVVLEAMKEDGTEDIVFFSHNGLPAIADAEEPDNIITFQTFEADEDITDDGEAVH